jgi:hypothetical protein
LDDEKVPVLHCPTCYSTKFQLSRPRPEDRLQILTFKQPVRCKKCSTRIYAGRSYARWLRKQEERPEVSAAEVDLTPESVAE